MIRTFFGLLGAKRMPAPIVIDSPPPAPRGWKIVPCATPGATSYEVETLVPYERTVIGSSGPGIEMCGLNALEFHGFAPETLSIGDVRVRMVLSGIIKQLRITYRFDYCSCGWQVPGVRKPIFDYAQLPFADSIHSIEQ